MKDVILYGSTTCGHCNNLKAFLKSKNIEFSDLDIMHDKEALNKVVDMGAQSLPVLTYDNKVVVGYNEKEVCDLLGIENA